MATPIFEDTTSTLYYSNDGRLRLVDFPRQYALELDGDEVFRTHERVLVDAYIAGYDLAERELRRRAGAAYVPPTDDVVIRKALEGGWSGRCD